MIATTKDRAAAHTPTVVPGSAPAIMEATAIRTVVTMKAATKDAAMEVIPARPMATARRTVTAKIVRGGTAHLMKFLPGSEMMKPNADAIVTECSNLSGARAL